MGVRDLADGPRIQQFPGQRFNAIAGRENAIWILIVGDEVLSQPKRLVSTSLACLLNHDCGAAFLKIFSR